MQFLIRLFLTRLFLLSSLLISATVRAEERSFSYQEVKDLPRLDQAIFDWPVEQRLDWLHQQLQSETLPAAIYRFKRTLSASLFYSGAVIEAKNLCIDNPPFPEDFYYRSWCVEALFTEHQDYIQQKLAIASDAKAADKLNIAVEALSEAGWRQSQNGDIAAAFATYEHALEIAPRDDLDVLYTTMFNIASMYIVHGDSELINKGLGLLAEIKTESQALLEQANTKDDADQKSHIMANMLLADFNSGIAHTLHLYQYEKALVHFDSIIAARADFELEALSFAAIAAAELNQRERVETYLLQIAERTHAEPVVNAYLSCYRDLARRHFESKQSIATCFDLDPNTTIEVTVDIYKRIAQLREAREELLGLRELKKLFVEKIEPELKKRASAAASNAELKRLETESKLKSEILDKERELKAATENEKQTQQKYFIAIFLVLALGMALVITQLRQKRKLAEQFEQMSLKDGLTDLGNRRFFEHNITREIAYIKRHHKFDHTSLLSLFIFDIDHFKKINDQYGHDSGDAVLVEFSRRIKEAIRETDLLIRWGGEEFVYVARVKNEQEIFELADRLNALIKNEKFTLPNHPSIQVTATIGVVQTPFFADESLIVPWQQLVSLADLALYQGKLSRDCWVMLKAKDIQRPEQIPDLLNQPLEKTLENGLLEMVQSKACHIFVASKS